MATPQIPFISAPFKKTDDVDWTHPLKKYIARFYQDDPEKFKEETQAFNRLRQDIRGAGKDITGRDLLYRYFGQLELLDLRFPVDEKHVKVLFNWYVPSPDKVMHNYQHVETLGMMLSITVLFPNTLLLLKKQVLYSTKQLHYLLLLVLKTEPRQKVAKRHFTIFKLLLACFSTLTTTSYMPHPKT